MRAIVFLISVIFLFNTANAQYEKGVADVFLGGGVGVYGVKSNDNADTTVGFATVSGLLHLTIDYAVISQLSLGIDFERSGFVKGKDSASVDIYIYANTFRLNILFRVVNIQNNALSIKGSAGISRFTIGNRANGIEIRSTGFTYEMGIQYQYFFDRRWGVFQNTSYSNYKYGKFTNRKDKILRTMDDSKELEVILSGMNVRLGLVAKF